MLDENIWLTIGIPDLSSYFYLLGLHYHLFQRQRLLQSANGVSSMTLDGKQELLENGLLHGDKDEYQEDTDATNYLVPFSVPSKIPMSSLVKCNGQSVKDPPRFQH